MDHPNPLKRPATRTPSGQRPTARRRVQFIIDDDDDDHHRPNNNGGGASRGSAPSGSHTQSVSNRPPPILATGDTIQTRIILRPSAIHGANVSVSPSVASAASTGGRGSPVTTTPSRPSTDAVLASGPAVSAEAPKPARLLPKPTPAAHTAILGAHYTVSKTGIPDSKFDAHRRWLTVEPPPNQYRPGAARGRGRGSARGRRARGGAPALSTQHVDAETGTETVRLYREDNDTFTVPRHYGLARWGMPPPQGDKRTLGTATCVPFTGTLTSEQTEVCRRVLVQFGIDPAAAAERLRQRPVCEAPMARASFAVALASRAAESALASPAPNVTLHPTVRPNPRGANVHIAPDASRRAESDAAAEAAERARLTRTPGASVKCPCGFGKTVCAIYIMCMTGRKAIFTVAQEDHMDKTEEEIRRFAPTARIGRVHRDRLDVGPEFDIVLAMVQTLLARRYDPHVFDSFGLWVADEMHHMAAPAFSQVGSTLCCYYTLGLTATPRRKDGLTPALFWTFGPMVANVRRVWDGVVCRMVRYAKGEQGEILMRNGQPNIPLMITRLAIDPVRNHHVARAIVDCMVNPRPLSARRKVIVLSDRRDQLVLLRELILDAMMGHLSGQDVIVPGDPADPGTGPRPPTADQTHPLADQAATASVARDLLAIDAESELNRTLIVSLLPPPPPLVVSDAALVGSNASAARPAPLPLPLGCAPRFTSDLVAPLSGMSSSTKSAMASIAAGHGIGDVSDGGVTTAAANNNCTGAKKTTTTTDDGSDDSQPNDESTKGEPLFSIGFFVGGMKRQEREQGKRCDVILATYAEAGEGMDIPQLDTVVMVSPRSDVEQATGRALRTHPAKNEPLFIYFVDDFSLFRNQGWIVQRYCAGEGYRVRWETID